MGLIRFLLAAGVVLGHAKGWGGFRNGTFFADGFILPYQAVQGFFILSGFYMALTYPKYAGKFEFYFARYLRLAPSYWIVAAIGISLWFVFPDDPRLSEPFLRNIHTGGWWGAVVAFANVTLIGSDCIWYFPNLFPPNSDWPQWWAIPPIWSIGTEIWFYLLVPLLIPARTRTLLALIVAGTAVRSIFFALGWPFHPWQQNVILCELPFFLIGILSYRFYIIADKNGLFNLRLGVAALSVVTIFLSLGNTLHLFIVDGESLWNSALVAIIFFVFIPPIFFLTRQSILDRFIGDFSYPIYLLHIAIGNYSILAQQLWQGYFLLLLCVIAAAPLVLFVDRPIDNWRRRLLRKNKAPRTAIHTDAWKSATPSHLMTIQHQPSAGYLPADTPLHRTPCQPARPY